MNNEQNDCPLSTKEWILFLSGEISNLENGASRGFNNFFPVIALLTLASAVIISSAFSAVSAGIPESNKANIFSALGHAYQALNIVFIMLILVFIYLLVELMITKRKADSLKNIRNNIMDGSLNDANEIRERWSNVMHSTYRELLRF